MTTTQPDINKIGGAFVKHYYTTFDSERKNLANLYKDSSKLTWEGEAFQGSTAIIGKLTSLKFTKIQHAVKTLDVQPGNNCIILFVCGDVKLDDSTNAIKFSQIFCLMPTDQKMSNFWVANDIFRLNYA
eukprot:TRINITY_DN5936_c0_g1_i1.p1 TRINITY_DN5936_c0_g1~~TRINITY_DN5936_c0_g1_i1.p1  ORF type:complete len:148 (+),score=14.66 TRINITY_DN5936_c0_g1_i1:58-444(+)